MIKLYRIFRLALAVPILLGGCTYSAQTVHLQPHVQDVDTNDGHGLPVTILVKDERPTQDFGHRGFGGDDVATITSDSDVAVVVKQALDQALANRGFKVVGRGNTADRTLTVRVRVRALKIQLHKGTWGARQEANAAAGVTVEKNGLTYENFYRVDSDRSKRLTATTEQNSDYINMTLSKLIEKITNDKKLIVFMAS
jgi:uncharacterized lipoprotein YajG